MKLFAIATWILLAAYLGRAEAALGILEQKYQENEAAIPDPRYPSAGGKVGEIAYRRFEDGSAAFHATEGDWPDVTQRRPDDEWSVSCKIDAMDDSRACSIIRRELQLAFMGSCSPFVRVGSDHFPRTPSLIRLDGGKPIATADKDGMFSAEASRRLVSAFRKAKRAMTRFQRWPYEGYVDDEIALTGLPESMDYVCWAMKRLKK
jgi:hypothetical protein